MEVGISYLVEPRGNNEDLMYLIMYYDLMIERLTHVMT